MPTATMDFFEHQDRARRKTGWLVFYFGVAVLLISAAVYLAVLVGLVFTPLNKSVLQELQRSEDARWWAVLWNAKLFFGVVVATLLVIIATSATKVHELAAGGHVVASRLGGRRLDPQSPDPEERRLLNVVEEMAIASGVPVPEIYVLDDEKGINAFAAGYTTSDAVIGATRGTVRLLNRAELQGVIAHEFSHLLNGDMRLNIRLIGLLHGILAIALIGRALIRLNTDSRRKKGGTAILGVGLLAVGSIGVFFGRLIKAAVARQREFLADAAAVQFTRYPEGLANALKKIGGLAHGSRLRSPNTEEASHLFFSNGLAKSWIGLMSTHPPLVERISRIDPAFDGKFPNVVIPMEPVELPVAPSAESRPDLAKVLSAGRPETIMAAGVLHNLGAPGPIHLHYAARVLDSLPATLRDSAHETPAAVALIYALLLSSDAEVRTGQLKRLAESADESVADRVRSVAVEVGSFGSEAKLPLLELSLSSLRRLSAEQYDIFAHNVQHIIEADRAIDLFEYCLQKTLIRHLDTHFKVARRPAVQYYVLKPLVPDCAVLVSALAHLGHDDPAEIESAFRQGVQQLHWTGTELRLLDLKDCNLPQIDTALDHLNQAAPQLKRLVLHACAHAVAADGRIQRKEAELLRAIADTLDCPLPPFVQPSGMGQN